MWCGNEFFKGQSNFSIENLSIVLEEAETLSKLLQQCRRCLFGGPGNSSNWNAPDEFDDIGAAVTSRIASHNILVLNDPCWVQSMGTPDGWHFPATIGGEAEDGQLYQRSRAVCSFLVGPEGAGDGYAMGFSETAMVVRMDGAERPPVENVQNMVMHQEAKEWRKRDQHCHIYSFRGEGAEASYFPLSLSK